MTVPSSAQPLDSGETVSIHRAWPWFTAAIALVLLDQVTKVLVRTFLVLGHPVPLIGKSLVRLTYVLNPGIAFGLELFDVSLLLVFGWIAAAVLSFYLYRLARRVDPLRWPVMLFLAGAVGNSIDRLLFGQVTDFVDVDMPDFIMERFAVFNVADTCVTIGIVLLAILVLFFQRKTEDRALAAAGTLPILTLPENAHPEEINRRSELDAPDSNVSDSLPSDHRTGSSAGAD